MINVPKTKLLFFDIETVGIEEDFKTLKKNRPELAKLFETYKGWIVKRFPEEENSTIDEMFYNKSALIPEFAKIIVASFSFYTPKGEIHTQTFSSDEEVDVLTEIKGLLNKVSKLDFYLVTQLLSDLPGVDMNDPQKMLDSMGLNMDELNKSFIDASSPKTKLRYSYKSINKEPEYAYDTDSGFDLRSNIKVTLGPLERTMIPTGLYFDIPEGYEIQVRPKSGLAIKKGLSMVNTPGTIDQGYTGEVNVILVNLSNETHTIEVGDKVGQAVLCPVMAGKFVDLQRVLNVEEKDRGNNGFGSTGN